LKIIKESLDIFAPKPESEVEFLKNKYIEETLAKFQDIYDEIKISYSDSNFDRINQLHSQAQYIFYELTGFIQNLPIIYKRFNEIDDFIFDYISPS